MSRDNVTGDQETPSEAHRVPPTRPGPVGGKRHANRLRRTRELTRAGLDLFLHSGVESVTIDEIVNRAGMAKGSFYRYFEDKEHLVQATMAPVAEAFRSAMKDCGDALEAATSPQDLFAAYQVLAGELAPLLADSPDEILLYLQECRSPAVGARRPIRLLADELVAGAVSLTEAAHTHGLLREFPARVSALSVVGAAERLLYGHLSGEELGDPTTVSFALISMVLDGLRANPD